MTSRRHQGFSQGFTLVELLVVIGLIGLLISMLLPTIRVAQDRARRTECSARLRQLTAAVASYAIENKGRVPTGMRNSGGADEHCIWISTATYDSICQYLGTRKSTE